MKNTAEDEKERKIERRGFTDEPTNKNQVRGRKYCVKNGGVGGRGGLGERYAGPKIQHRGTSPAGTLAHRPAVIQRRGSVALAPRILFND